MKLILTLFIFLFLSFQGLVFAQLQDGAIAPDWTLTDIEGNTHHLYNYLNQGKMVVIEFSATWCGPCWNYMLSGALEDFWDEHGPNGLDDAMVFYIEADQSTGMADLLGQTPSSQGNWVANIPFPIIDLQVGENVDNEYLVNYYPTLYATCSDKSIYELGQVPAQTWSDFVQACGMTADEGDVFPALCVGDGAIFPEVTGGWEPYSFHWSNGSTAESIEGLSAGTYQLTVTEAMGKISKLTIIVPGATEEIAISDSEVEPALCNATSTGSVTIEVEGGIPGYEFDWSNGASTQNLTNVPADVYTVTVTDDNGCTLVESFFVDEPDELEVGVETTPDNCDQSDGTITLAIDGGVGGYEISASEGTVYGNQILDLPAGYVTVEVEDANGCSWTDVALIDFLDGPNLDVTEGAELNCIQNTTSISGYASGGYNEFDYHWTTADGHIITDPLASTITVDAPGSYLLEVTDIISGCMASATSVVISNMVLPVVDAGQNIPVNCEIQQVTLLGSGDTSNQIVWTTPDGHIVSGGDTYTPVVDAAGTYFITVTNPQSNCSNQDSMLVPNESSPANAAFQYQTSSLTMSGTDASTGSNLSGWLWTFGDGATSEEVNVVHTYAAAGIYEVCHSVQNGCGVSQTCQTVTVTSSGSVISVDAVIENVLCFGQSTGGIVLTVNGGTGNYTYLWTAEDTTYTTQSLDDVPAGVYQLVISDDQGNIFIGSYTIEQPSVLTLLGSTVVDNLCFGQTNGSVSIDITGGVPPYLYSWNGGPYVPENYLNQLPGGIINASILDANGCPINAGPYSIYEPPALQQNSVVVTDATGATQSDGSITVEITGGTAPYVVSWNNGATGTTLTGLPPGEYTYLVTDANGCQFEAPAPIVVGFPTSTTDLDWPDYVTVTPNPTKGDVIIKWSDLPSGNASLSLMTLDGKTLASQKMSGHSGTWDLTPVGLSNGLYIILLAQDKQVVPFKLIVL
jgi:PKD repeat protein